MSAPVVFLVFNRPERTRRVFERIRAARPARMLVVGDGPRPQVPEDAARVAAVRQLIAAGVDWPCAVECEYAPVNLGCRARVSSGLTWAFSRVEEAIVLEDDTLPDPSFFPYCAELLARYRDDARVMHIGGNNFLGPAHRSATSYVFSRYGHIWGWATWRRAWQRYDLTMPSWSDPAVRARLARECHGADERGYWHSIFTRSAGAAPEIDTWDYPWTFACWQHRGLATYPAVNLVENIGFGADATHTTEAGMAASPAVEAMPFPLVHPLRRAASAPFDRRAFHSIFMPETPLRARLGRWLGQVLAGA